MQQTITVTNAHTGRREQIGIRGITALAYTGCRKGSTICIAGPEMSNGSRADYHHPVREPLGKIRWMLARARATAPTTE
jgi:hypothetical protein